MTSPAHTETSTSHRSKSRLYRTLLGIAVAALLAAWLPFSVLYISALTKHAAAVARAGASQTISLSAGHHARPPLPVTTRTSSALAPPAG